MSELCKVNYPLYCCHCLDDITFVVAGGGGAAKTGVRNCVQMFELKKAKRKCIAETVEQLDTDTHAVMSMSYASKTKDTNESVKTANNSMLALSVGKKCCIYSINKTEATSKTSSNNQPSGVTKRKKGSSSEPPKTEVQNGVPNYEFNLVHEIDAVPGKESFQTSVKLSKDGSLVVSGGSDGHVRAWNLPSKEKVFDTQGHKDDITDIDISPDCKKIVTVSRDGKAFFWDASSGHKTKELHLVWNMQVLSRNYRFRNCRFSIVPEQPARYVLFTSHSPVQQNSKMKSYCRLTKWASKHKKENDENSELEPAVMQNTGKEAISAIAVSRNGVFVGVGFMEGSVAIYIAFSLQCAHRVNNCHSIFVTSLSFLDDSVRSRAITGSCDAALVSVSADCTCKLTKLSSRTLFSLYFVILLCILTLIGVAIYLYSVGFL